MPHTPHRASLCCSNQWFIRWVQQCVHVVQACSASCGAVACSVSAPRLHACACSAWPLQPTQCMATAAHAVHPRHFLPHSLQAGQGRAGQLDGDVHSCWVGIRMTGWHAHEGSSTPSVHFENRRVCRLQERLPVKRWPIPARSRQARRIPCSSRVCKLQSCTARSACSGTRASGSALPPEEKRRCVSAACSQAACRS
jgi:hypothetical protein